MPIRTGMLLLGSRSLSKGDDLCILCERESKILKKCSSAGALACFLQLVVKQRENTESICPCTKRIKCTYQSGCMM